MGIKRIVIGDIHGNLNVFNKIYEKEVNDIKKGEILDVILLGDYFDTFDEIPSHKQIENFNTLLNIQKNHIKNHGKFIMLMGNHDFHYLPSANERYKGFNLHDYIEGNIMVIKAFARHDLKIAYIDKINRTIYSHAGVTNKWINERGDVPIPLNMIDLCPIKMLKFTYDKSNGIHSNDPLDSPLWVRPSALLSDMYEDFDNDLGEVTKWTQVVGHTPCRRPIIVHEDGSEFKEGELWSNARLYVIDCLDEGYYLSETLDENLEVINREIKNVEA